jgi:peptidyl-prolyl cis-trans isomerase C
MLWRRYDTLAPKKGEMAMHRGVILIGIALLLGLWLSCTKTEDKVAARVGDQVITVGMLKDEFLAISPEARPDLGTIDEKEQFARDIVSKEILESEALKMGLDKLPEVAAARDNTIRRAAWQAFFEDRIRSKVHISEEDIQALYAKQRYRYHLGWVFLRSGAVAQEISRRIKAGESFENLAKIYSMDASKERDGDIGTRALGTMPDYVEDLVTQMAPGQVSDPIAYDGYHILVKVYEKQEMELPDLEAMRSGLESMLRTRAETQLQRDTARELARKYRLTFNDDALDLIASKTQAIYGPEGVPPGRIPEFSDEEMARTLLTYEGGEWQVRTYVERLKQQVPVVRPSYGADRETIKSVINDFVTGDLWMLEIRNQGYEQRPEVTKAAHRALEEAMVTAMHDQLVREVKVDEENLKQFYEEHQAEMVSEPGTRLAVIAVETEPEAEEIYKQLEAGAKFEDLARERSLDRASGENGGALRGALYKRQLEQYPDLEEVVNNLSEGSYSRPLPTPPGFLPGQYLILRILETLPAKQMDYDEVKQMLGSRVLQMEQDRVFGEWLRQKMEEYKVEIYPDALGPIDFIDLKGQVS